MLQSILILTIFLCCSTITTAQDTSGAQESSEIRDWIGITGGLSLPYYNGFPASSSWSDEPLTFQKDKLAGYHFGIEWQRKYSSLGSSHYEILRLNYSNVPGTFADSGTTIPGPDTTYFFLRQYGRVFLQMLNVEFLFSMEFANRWYINLGPSLGYYLVGSSFYEQTLTIEHPQDGRFVGTTTQYRDGGKTEVLLEEKSPQFKTRIGVKLGVRYEVPLGSRINLVPELGVDLALNDITKDFDWQLHIVRFGIGVQYGL